MKRGCCKWKKCDELGAGGSASTAPGLNPVTSGSTELAWQEPRDPGDSYLATRRDPGPPSYELPHFTGQNISSRLWFKVQEHLERAVKPLRVSQVVLAVKSQCRRRKRRGFDPWVGKTPWRRAWQPTVFLPGESHGQRSLVGYNPWGRKESDMTEQLSKHMKHLGMSGPFLSVRNLQHFTFIPA